MITNVRVVWGPIDFEKLGTVISIYFETDERLTNSGYSLYLKFMKLYQIVNLQICNCEFMKCFSFLVYHFNNTRYEICGSAQLAFIVSKIILWL